MEWLYIIGIIGYYLYKAYSKGIENAADKNKPKKPIEPVGERKKEKTLDEILKELVENANKQEKKPTTTTKLPEKKVLQEQKKVVKEVQKTKPLPKKQVSTIDTGYDNVLHKHKNFKESVEYDESIENLLHGKIESIEQDERRASNKLGKEIGDHIARTYQEKLININNKQLTAKDLVVAQIIFERKYA